MEFGVPRTPQVQIHKSVTKNSSNSLHIGHVNDIAQVDLTKNIHFEKAPILDVSSELLQVVEMSDILERQNVDFSYVNCTLPVSSNVELTCDLNVVNNREPARIYTRQAAAAHKYRNFA
jgi:hypothetical protein